MLALKLARLAGVRLIFGSLASWLVWLRRRTIPQIKPLNDMFIALFVDSFPPLAMICNEHSGRSCALGHSQLENVRIRKFVYFVHS